jgi:phage terminase large subunit GpA-like protein
MDALSPSHPAQRVTFMKAAQVGATEAGNNWIGFVIHHAPGPMLAVLPTVEMAKRTSRGRIDPLIEDSPALKERVSPARSRDAGNSMLSKEFPGGILVLTGANSATGLRSMPARYVFLDEVDAYPASADEEGDPVTLAEARTTTFAHRRKVFMVSTPTIRGLSRIEREFEASDQRRYFVPCPHCGHKQWLQFERLRWAKGKPETAAYYCAGCERPIAEHHKTQMLARGEWRATAASDNPNAIGFHLSALYSPIGWKAGSRSRATGSRPKARTRCCAPRATRSWARPGPRAARPRNGSGWRIGAWHLPAQIPAGGLFLTAGADVQKDRIEVDIWAWGRGLDKLARRSHRDPGWTG